MSYFNDIDQWLDDLLVPIRLDIDNVRDALKSKLLESYRNGQAAAQKPAQHEAPYQKSSGQPAAFRRPERGGRPHRAR